MNSVEQEIHPILKRYLPVADMILATFGRNCEVTIHDLRNFQSSLIYLKGNVTGRNTGAPVTDVILKELHKYGNDIEDILGFMTRSMDGKILKASITFIRDNEEKVLGCIGVNFDITGILAATRVLNDLAITNNMAGFDPMPEMYEKDIGEVFQYVIESTLEDIGVPIEEMSRRDKKFFVKQVDDKGVFLINGSIEIESVKY